MPGDDVRGRAMETKYTTCVFCDGGCRVKAEVDGDQLSVLPADPAFPAICPKAGMVDAYRLHPDRVTVPLKNVGERGEPQGRRCPGARRSTR